MKTKRYFVWVVLAAGPCLGLVWQGLIHAQRPASDASTSTAAAVQHREGPIFLGPHEASVTSIAFSPDGKTLATGSNDLHLWDARTGQHKAILTDDGSRGIRALAFSPDGSLLATVGTFLDKDLKLWDVASGRIVREFGGGAPEFNHAGWSNAVAFSPAGQIVAMAGEQVLLRDVRTGNILATLKHPSKGVKALAFSADGKSLATAAADGKIRLWSLPSGALEVAFAGPLLPASAVAFSPDGARVIAVTGGSKLTGGIRVPALGGRIWSWDRANGKARKIEIGNAAASALAFVTPSTVAVGAGREVLLVDLAAEQQSAPRVVCAHSDEVSAVTVSPDGQMVASGGRDRTVDVVDLPTGKLAYRLPGLTDIIMAVATSSDGKRFATANLDLRFTNRALADDPSFASRQKEYFSGESNAGRVQPSEVRIWSTDDGRMQSMLPLPPCQVTSAVLIPKSDLLAVAGWLPEKGGMLTIWDATTARQLHDWTAKGSEILTIASSPDGQTLASGDAEGNLVLRQVASGDRTRSMHHDHRLEALAFSRDGRFVAAGDGDRTVRVYELFSGDVTQTLKSRSYIKALDFSPDGNLLAAGTQDAGFELWDLRAGTPSRTFKAAGDYFHSMPGFVRFSPDGRFVVCGGHGKNIAVFDVAKAALHGELAGHGHAPTAATFLPDGRFISGGEERTIRLWDPDTLKLLATWIVMPPDAKQNWHDEWIGFTPSGQ